MPFTWCEWPWPMVGFDQEAMSEKPLYQPQTLTSEGPIQSILEFFTSQFASAAVPNQVTEEVVRALENPIFKQYIFANSFLGVIDQSNMTYRYFSPQVKDFFWR